MQGHYPTISDFEYREEITFSHSGKPFLFYRYFVFKFEMILSQKTWNLKTGAPMHAEMGFIRAPSVDKAEIVLAQPTGNIFFYSIHF